LAGDDPAAVAVNLDRLRRELGLKALVGLRQVHGTAVVAITAAGLAARRADVAAGQTGSFVPGEADVIAAGQAASPIPGQAAAVAFRPPDSEQSSGRADGSAAAGLWPAFAEGDALVTAERGVGLLVRAADCVPILLADPEAGLVGAAHAGRAGLLAGVVEAVVAALRSRGARRLTAWIGPYICPACYELPAAMAAAAWARLPAARAKSARGAPALDLGAGAAAELGRLGCAVVRCDPCTAEAPDLFFSYRRDGATGRLGGVVWLAP
jgi:YfiH family protein